MIPTLQDLGWSDFFARQINADEDAAAYRIASVHRDRVMALGNEGETTLITLGNTSIGDFTVGDWVLGDESGQIIRRLDRQTIIQRRAAGTDARAQLVAANVDVLFIVTSCNDDFNVARLERYLALAYDSGCLPVLVLTKADLCDDPADYSTQAQKIDPSVPVLCIDAKDAAGVQQVADWCKPGQTGAFLGSSGVGKTTLANGLSGGDAVTAEIREDDARGRHATTSRSLVRMNNGGWIIDTPGMRALQLFEAEDGIERLFDDIAQLAAACRFSDCSHRVEPGCAVQAAIAKGDLDPARLARREKLMFQDQHNTQSVAQARARDRAFGKMVHHTQRAAKTRKGR